MEIAYAERREFTGQFDFERKRNDSGGFKVGENFWIWENKYERINN